MRTWPGSAKRSPPTSGSTWWAWRLLLLVLAALQRDLAALGGRLIGEPGMVAAIGAAFSDIVAAEGEILRQRVADRPFAGPLAQFHELQLQRDRNDDALLRAVSASNSARSRSGPASAVAPMVVVICLRAAGTARGSARPPPSSSGRGVADERAAAARKLEPVHLADDGVAADPAELAWRSGWRSDPPPTAS
jgi:hypothetical protein